MAERLTDREIKDRLLFACRRSEWRTTTELCSAAGLPRARWTASLRCLHAMRAAQLIDGRANRSAWRLTASGLQAEQRKRRAEVEAVR